MGKTKIAKKRNPNDATFRNITALKKRVDRLEIQVAELSVLWIDLNNSEPNARRKITKQ